MNDANGTQIAYIEVGALAKRRTMSAQEKMRLKLFLRQRRKRDRIRKKRRKLIHRRLYSGTIFGDLCIFLFLLLLAVFMLLPLYLTVSGSLKPVEELYNFPPRIFPNRPTLDNFAALRASVSNLWVPFSRYVFNSVFVAASVTALQVLISGTAAYALAKIKFPGSVFLNRLIELSILFTGTTTGVMTYIVVSKTHIIDSYFALILPFIAMPLGLFFMRQFMGQVSESLIEAAKLDGAGDFRICWQVVMPNVRPAWITMMIFAFQNAWQIDGMSYIFNEALKPVPTVMQQLQSQNIAQSGVAAAAVVITMIPPVVIFLFFQSSILETMAQSGMKE